MFLQVSFLTELPVADITLKRFLPGVDPHMAPQVTRLTKRFLADLPAVIKSMLLLLFTNVPLVTS